VFNPNAFNPQPEMSALAWNGALWVAVLDNNGVGEIYTSFDGWAWTQEFVPGLPSLYSVAWNGSSWMAGSLSGVATSLNGQAWTYQPSAHHVNSLAWTGTEWVAAMGGSAVIRSANGTVWTVETVPLGGPSAAVAYRRPLFPPWP
jgi:hypothetical protein